MNDEVYTLHRGSTPLLVSLPHVGREITAELQPRYVTMICPYCNIRAVALTLTDESGNYSMCRGCAIRWGMKLCGEAQVAEAGSELRLLEYWYQLPSAEVRR